jgi:hypothetical protein
VFAQQAFEVARTFLISVMAIHSRRIASRSLSM